MISPSTMSRALVIVAVASVGVSSTALACAGYRPSLSMNGHLFEPGVASDYVGLTVEAAGEKAAEDGRLFRVVEKDGEPLMVTKDYRVGRVNATVEKGVVVSVYFEGQADS